MQKPQAPISAIRWLPCRNNSGEVVPAFGVVRITGADTKGIITVAKPNIASDVNTLVNGPVPIGNGNIGLCTAESPADVLYETADGTPALGEAWGSGSGTFKLRKNNTGYMIVGGVTAGRVLASRAATAGGGGGSMVFSGAKVFHNAAQVIPHDGLTVLFWNSEEFDTDGYHVTSGATNNFTFASNGFYLCAAQIRWDEVAGIGDRSVFILKNGAEIAADIRRASELGSVDGDGQTAITLASLSVIDSLQVAVRQTSGYNVNVRTTSRFWIAKLGS